MLGLGVGSVILPTVVFSKSKTTVEQIADDLVNAEHNIKEVGIGVDGQLYIDTSDGNTDGFATSIWKKDDGRWHYHATVYENGSHKNYINGVEV